MRRFGEREFETENTLTRKARTVAVCDRVAIAGADNEVDPRKLFDLSMRFPFVEWSVLYKNVPEAELRYPAVEWIVELANLSRKALKETGRAMRLSLHLCSRAVKDLIRYRYAEFNRLGNTLEMFQRIQLNTLYHNEYQHIPMLAWNIRHIMRHNPQIIVQLNGSPINERVWRMICDAGIDAVCLHDLSGGRGRREKEWRGLIGAYTGYAGGLDPENIEREFERISAVADGVWLDLESGARDAENHFVLSRAEEILKVAEAWVQTCP